MHIMPLLMLKDLVHIKSAAVTAIPGCWKSGFKMREPLDLDAYLHGSSVALAWILKHKLHVKGMAMVANHRQKNCGHGFDLVKTNFALLRNITLRVSKFRPSIRLLTRCTQLHLAGLLDDRLVDLVCAHSVKFTGLELDGNRAALVAHRIIRVNPGLQSITLTADILCVELVHAIKNAGRGLKSLQLTLRQRIVRDYCY